MWSHTLTSECIVGLTAVGFTAESSTKVCSVLEVRMTTGGVTHVMPCHQLEWVWKFRVAKLVEHVHTHTHVKPV